MNLTTTYSMYESKADTPIMIFVLKKIFEDKIYKKELASYEIRLTCLLGYMLVLYYLYRHRGI